MPRIAHYVLSSFAILLIGRAIAEGGRIYSPDHVVTKFCLKNGMSCVLDMTSKSSSCDFDAKSQTELNRLNEPVARTGFEEQSCGISQGQYDNARLPPSQGVCASGSNETAGMKIIAERCPGYHWRRVGRVWVLEPKEDKSSSLNVRVREVDSERRTSPGGYIIHLTAVAGIRISPEYHGSGLRGSTKKPIRYKTPEGTLKNALISAAGQNPGTTWSVALLEKGFRIDASD